MSNEQLDALIKSIEGAPTFFGDCQAIIEALRELKIARAEVARLEAMVVAQDTVIGDERRAHEVEIARLETVVEMLSDTLPKIRAIVSDGLDGADFAKVKAFLAIASITEEMDYA